MGSSQHDGTIACSGSYPVGAGWFKVGCCTRRFGLCVDVNGKIVDITSDTQSLWKSDMKGVVLLIRAVNRNGTLGEQGVYYL